eukprot:1761015-Lingulodinium_polyedra.AAC.1
MKHLFSSIGNPACMKWHEIPLVHSPAVQKSQGRAHVDVELDSRAATGDVAAGAGSAAEALAAAEAAAARAAAAFFSGRPGFNEVPPSRMRADNSLSAKSETSLKAVGVMTCGSPTLFLSIIHLMWSCGSALSKTLPKMLSNAL